MTDLRSRTLMLVAALGAAALAAPAALAQGGPAGTLRIGLDVDADALDPTLSRTYTGRIVFNALCDKLVDIDDKLAIVPQLATSYTWLDPVTLEIKLRAGAKFHDGTDVDAESVRFNMDRHLTMQGSTRRGEIAGIDRVEVVDKLTARIVLKSANVPFLAQLTDRAGMLVSPKAATALGADFGKAPVCAGPFKFVERIPQDRIVLERFADYWDAKNIHLNRVVYQPIIDGSVRQANLRAGSIDMGMGFLPNDAVDLAKDSRVKVFTFAGLGYQSLTFNHTNGTRPRTPMMSDARVRKAFELAIDRTALIQVVYNGLYTPIAQMVPPNSPFYSPALPPPGRDIAKAKALLAEAGVKTPLTVELLITTSPDARQAGEVIQSMVAEAGFDLKLRSTEFVTALQASDKGDFEIFMIGWSGRADADGNVWNMVRTGGPLNASAYSNKEVDSLLEQARAVPEVAARRALYGKVAAQLHQDLPLMYVFSGKWIMATTGRVSGFTPVPDGLIRLQGMKVQ